MNTDSFCGLCKKISSVRPYNPRYPKMRCNNCNVSFCDRCCAHLPSCPLCYTLGNFGHEPIDEMEVERRKGKIRNYEEFKKVITKFNPKKIDEYITHYIYYSGCTKLGCSLWLLEQILNENAIKFDIKELEKTLFSMPTIEAPYKLKNWEKIKKAISEEWEANFCAIYFEFKEHHKVVPIFEVVKEILNKMNEKKRTKLEHLIEQDAEVKKMKDYGKNLSFGYYLSKYLEEHISDGCNCNLKESEYEFKTVKCKYCGTNFSPHNLGSFETKLKHWDFCYKCLATAFHLRNGTEPHTKMISVYLALSEESKTQPKQRYKTEGEMANGIQKFVKFCGGIPPASILDQRAPKIIFERFDYQKVIPYFIEDQTPTLDQIKNTFDSWLKALIYCGLLEKETLKTSRGYRCVAIDGHECNSLAERIIDDWLNGKKISHEKEPLYPYDEKLNPNMMFRGDWKLKNGTFLEYIGLRGENDYDKRVKEKIELAKKYKMRIIMILDSDIANLDKLVKKFGKTIKL